MIHNLISFLSSNNGSPDSGIAYLFNNSKSKVFFYVTQNKYTKHKKKEEKKNKRNDVNLNAILKNTSWKVNQSWKSFLIPTNKQKQTKKQLMKWIS